MTFNKRFVGEEPEADEPQTLRMPIRKVRSEGKIQSYATLLMKHISNAYRWVRRKHTELGPKKFWLRVFGIGVGVVMLYLLFLFLSLPNINDPRSLRASQSTVITDRNGTELYRVFSDEDRTYVEGEGISPFVKKAVVAIEDERFYTRGCLDMRALARVIFRFGQAGGASTLTRQLARNALALNRENIVSRKLKELFLGCTLEQRYSKDELLVMYLNWIPFGQSAYGIEQASKRFFSKSASGLTLAESAVLASLPQRPSYFNPYGNNVYTRVTPEIEAQIRDGDISSTEKIPDEAVRIGLMGRIIGSGATALYLGGRTDQVLQNMLDQELITADEMQKALVELKTLKFKQAREDIRAPHFVLWVRDQVGTILHEEEDSGLLEQGGLIVETTLDWRLQQEAEKVVAARKDSTLELYGAHNIALMAMDPKTREILAYVGNSDYNDTEHGGKIDMVQVPRQPGSSFKPFAYASAFLEGYSPATPLYDVATKFGTDTPANFEGTFRGLMSARSALAGSRNIPAIKMFFLGGGEDSVLDTAARMGIETPRKARDAARQNVPDFGYGWPLAIGAAETPLAEMVNGYATFANGGLYAPSYAIKKITTAKGVLLYEAEDPLNRSSQAIDPRIAYQITSILSDVGARPDAFWQEALSVPGYEAAAKTGTSNKCLERNVDTNVCKDRRPESLWTMGYTPDLVTGVWVGNATSEALSPRADGLNVAAPIWKTFMTQSLKLMPESKKSFAIPEGLTQPQISRLSGELPTECTPIGARSSDVFLSERSPNLDDPACVKLLVDKVTGLLASDSCPADATEERSFLLPKSELPSRWPLWEAGVQAWADGMRRRTTSGTGGFVASGGLLLPIAPTEKCDGSKTPERFIKPEVSFEFPSPGGTVPYPSFQPRLDLSSGSGIKEITFTLDGKQIGKVTSTALPILRVPSSVSEAGTHTLEVLIMDGYFNTAKDSVTFSFGEDVGVPSVRIMSPDNGASLKTTDSVEISASASDDEGPVKYVEFYLDETLLSRKPKEPFSMSYPLTDVPPGLHNISAVVTDLSGKESVDRVEITVE